MQENEKNDIAEFILPQGILEYFIINKVTRLPKELNIYIEEKNLPPQEYQKDKLTSKGFFEEVKVQDFPIRGQEVYLLIKRRRWLNEDTGVIVCRDWELVAKGTRMTKEFAAFLKVISRFQAR